MKNYINRLIKIDTISNKYITYKALFIEIGNGIDFDILKISNQISPYLPTNNNNNNNNNTI